MYVRTLLALAGRYGCPPCILRRARLVVRSVAAPSPPLLVSLPDSVAPPLMPQVVADVAPEFLPQVVADAAALPGVVFADDSHRVAGRVRAQGLERVRGLVASGLGGVGRRLFSPPVAASCIIFHSCGSAVPLVGLSHILLLDLVGLGALGPLGATQLPVLVSRLARPLVSQAVPIVEYVRISPSFSAVCLLHT